jgi:hypothetical protein
MCSSWVYITSNCNGNQGTSYGIAPFKMQILCDSNTSTGFCSAPAAFSIGSIHPQASCIYDRMLFCLLLSADNLQSIITRASLSA